MSISIALLTIPSTSPQTDEMTSLLEAGSALSSPIEIVEQVASSITVEVSSSTAAIQPSPHHFKKQPPSLVFHTCVDSPLSGISSSVFTILPGHLPCLQAIQLGFSGRFTDDRYFPKSLALYVKITMLTINMIFSTSTAYITDRVVAYRSWSQPLRLLFLRTMGDYPKTRQLDVFIWRLLDRHRPLRGMLRWHHPCLQPSVPNSKRIISVLTIPNGLHISYFYPTKQMSSILASFYKDCVQKKSLASSIFCRPSHLLSFARFLSPVGMLLNSSVLQSGNCLTRLFLLLAFKTCIPSSWSILLP
ncbi:unnamed protein product [Somion occarium]|uniref:Uncharacterized protein n=1 Tax=Somion occarium TaxID=3059160 RepID=A0ABP1E7P3_9APHY